MTNKIVTLILPGFLPNHLDTESFELPVLAKLLSRSIQRSASDVLEEVIKDYFEGFQSKPVPLGAFGAFHHGLDSSLTNETWCKVQFIECQATHQTVYVVGKESYLEHDESVSLFKTFRDFFKEDGHSLHLTQNGEWYLHLGHSTAVKTYPVSSIMNKSIAPFLPTGMHQDYWRRLLTECQMLLATHPVNVKRHAKNKRILSSLWFEFLGSIDRAIYPKVSHICTNDASMLGLAHYAGITSSSIEQGFQGISNKKNVIVFDDTFYSLFKSENLKGLMDALLWWENNWFRPLAKAQKDGVQKLIINDLSKRQFVLTGFAQKFFWRKIKPLSNFTFEYR